MAFIKEESEDIRIVEVFTLKHEDPEEQTGLMVLKEETQELNEMEEVDKQHDLRTDEKDSPEERVQETESNFKCCHCGKCFSNKQNLEIHMRNQTGEKPFICKKCGMGFSQNRKLHVHMRIHTGEKRFACPQCGKCFTVKYSLQVHMRVHTGENPYTCPECGKGFKQKNSFNYHMRTHKGLKIVETDSVEVDI